MEIRVLCWVTSWVLQVAGACEVEQVRCVVGGENHGKWGAGVFTWCALVGGIYITRVAGRKYT